MRALALFLLVTVGTLSATLPRTILVDYDEDDSQLQSRQMSFGSGYTNVTLYDYHIKITAEQRMDDNQLLVIAFPTEMGISFTIHNVAIGTSPRYNLQGPVAKVHGTFRAQVNEGSPLTVTMMVPVQIAQVQEFSVSTDEALIQGYQFYKKQMSSTPQ